MMFILILVSTAVVVIIVYTLMLDYIWESYHAKILREFQEKVNLPEINDI